MTDKKYTLGIDIGSTTVKIAILDEENQLLFADYERHFANIQETLAHLLGEAHEKLGELTLQPDETLEIYRSTSDRLACTLTRAGVTENIFSKLDEDSTLTELQPGDNVLSMQAENGSGYLQASVSFYPMEAGILPEPL